MPVNLVFISYLPGQTLVRYAHSRFARVNMKIHTKFTGIEKGKVIIMIEVELSNYVYLVKWLTQTLNI